VVTRSHLAASLAVPLRAICIASAGYSFTNETYLSALWCVIVSYVLPFGRLKSSYTEPWLDGLAPAFQSVSRAKSPSKPSLRLGLFRGLAYRIDRTFW